MWYILFWCVTCCVFYMNPVQYSGIRQLFCQMICENNGHTVMRVLNRLMHLPRRQRSANSKQTLQVTSAAVVLHSFIILILYGRKSYVFYILTLNGRTNCDVWVLGYSLWNNILATFYHQVRHRRQLKILNLYMSKCCVIL